MEFVGLLFEVIFFGIGLYVYLIARGLIKVEDPSLKKQFDDLRKKYGTLIRILALALCAVMFLNIIFHIRMLWG